MLRCSFPIHLTPLVHVLSTTWKLHASFTSGFFSFLSHSFTVSPDHFFLYTQCKIYKQDSDERHYFLGGMGKKSIIPFFPLRLLILMLIVSLRFGKVWWSDERRPLLYTVPNPITADEWYISPVRYDKNDTINYKWCIVFKEKKIITPMKTRQRSIKEELQLETDSITGKG